MTVVQPPTLPAVELPTVPDKPEVPRWRGLLDLQPLTLEQYHRMIETGILAEDAPVALLEGYLVAKDRGKGSGMGHGHAHAAGVSSLYRLLFIALSHGWVVRSQLPITL